MFNTAENSKILSLRLLSNEVLHALLCCCFFLDKGQQLHKLPFLYQALACCHLRAGGDPVQKDAFTGLELPILGLDSAFADRIIKGQVLPLPGTGLLSEVPISELVEGQWVCLHTLDNQFLGIGQILDNECVRPKRMLSTDTLTLP